MTNTYHRYLNLPFKINPPEIFNENLDIVKHLILDDLEYPDIDQFFDQFGLFCARKECFYTPPYGKVPIHTDAGTYTNHAKINITWGPEEGVIQWWKSDIVEERVINGGTENTDAYHHNLWANEEDCTFLYEANTNIPSLVNVGILHGTNNPTPHGRWTLCFVPLDLKSYDMILWDQAINIFKEYIINE
jgi:hypothetical protein